jgi:hypothetical protein
VATESARSAQATVDALGTTLAGAEATVVAQEQRLAQAEEAAAAGLDPRFRTVSVQVDPAGLLAGDPNAEADARAALRDALAPFPAGCRAGVVLTFGRAATINEGVALAAAVNEVLPEAAPRLFRGAALDAFGDISPPPGQVDLRLYLFAGCTEGGATPGASPAS